MHQGKCCEGTSGTGKFTVIRNSDAHFLADIGRCYSRFLMERRDFGEFRMALKGEKGRAVLA